MAKITTSSANNSSEIPNFVDLLSIIKACQAISGELVLEELLAKMMKILMENAGAELGYLILNKDGEWVIEALGTITSDEVQVLQSIPLATVSNSNDPPMVSNAIINYVIRTQESLVLHDAVGEGDFIQDPYILRKQPKSILCTPLINQEKLIGIFYLENYRTTGAFTLERLEILKLFSSQVVISLKNATNYAQLREEVTQIKAELTQVTQQLELEMIDRQRTEAALHQSEERWQLAIEGANDGIWDYNAITGEHFLSPRCLEMVGYMYEQVNNFEKWLNYVHPDDVVLLKEAFCKHLNRETPYYSIEYRMRCQDGSYKWLLARGKGLWDEQGIPIRVVGSLKDITERKRAEEALQQSEARYRAIVEDQTELVSRFLSDGTLIFINEAYCRYFAVKREDLIGKHYAPVIFEEDLEHIEQLVKTITVENPVVTIENRVVVGQEVRWTQWINRGIFDTEGQLVELQSVGRDISELKQIEQALRESERRYRQIVETSEEGIWIIDLEGNTVFANPKIAEMLGYSGEEMQGMSMFSFMDEEGIAIAIKNLERRRQGIQEKHDFKFLRKDGSDLWTIISTTPTFDESGKPTGALGMLTDITKRKQAEEALQKSEQRYRQIVETAEEGIWVLDAEAKTTFVNRKMAQMLGYSVEEMIGIPLFDFITQDEKQFTKDKLNLRAKGIREQHEYKFLRKDGSHLWTIVSGNPIFDESGQYMGALGMIMDITQRKRTEEALEGSERLFRLLAEISPVGIFRANADGETIYANERACQIVGMSPKQVSGWQWTRYIHPEDADRVGQTWQYSIIHQVPWQLEYRLLHHQYGEVWVLAQAEVERDQMGNVVGFVGTLTDISDRKISEIALRKQKELLQTIFDHIPVMLCFYNSKVEVLLANAAFEKTLGWSLEELQHIDLWAECYRDPDYRASVLEFMMRADGTWRDLHQITRDGTVLETCWANVRLPDGSQVGIGQDITARKRAEQALQESEERWQLAIKGTNDGIWDWNIRTNKVFFSPRWKEIRGFAEDEISNSLDEWSKRIHPEDIDQVMQALWDHLDGKTPLFIIEYRVQHKDNTYKWVLDRGQAIRDEAGNVVRIAGSESDITQRKQAEEARLKSEHALAEAQRLAHLGNWSYDVATQKITWSDEVFRIYGLDPNQPEPTYEQHLQIIHPEDRELLQHNVELAITESRPYEHEIRIFLPDGSMRYTLGRGRPVFNEAGQVIQLFGTVQDITDRKQAEEALQQAKQAAEAANHAKSTFLANMSHELRTPLNAILGFSQLLKNNAELPSEQKKNLDTIIRSGEHLLTLINQVLDLSKIEAGRTTLNETDFDLYLFLDDLQDLFLLKANEKRLQLLFYHTSDAPQYVCTDEVKLRQVLVNLLSNALKFTKEGRITVRVSLATDDSLLIPEPGTNDREKISLHFEVADTGLGIAAEDLDSIFTAFVQTKTGQQFQEGTGLGLTICRKFVELMGGEITVSSELGCGTTFRFDIIASRVEATRMESPQVTRRAIALAPNQPRYRILIVDDSADNRHLLFGLLSPFGFELREANNGLEAIATWETWQPHLIFMDMRMPEMNGYEATRHIRTVNKNQATVIIAVTASSLEEERDTVLAAGCNHFIRKPYKEAEIFDALHKYIQVRFIYDEKIAITAPSTATEPEHLIPTALKNLPRNLVDSLLNALMALDVELIETLITQIRELNEPLANAITAFTNNFQYEELLDLIQSVELKND